jgi:hypothetical protein
MPMTFVGVVGTGVGAAGESLLHADATDASTSTHKMQRFMVAFL